MVIFPAIDLKNGVVVRLKQGDFNEVTQYSTDPFTVAQEWLKQGAGWLHIVDLDGAQTGEIRNMNIILDIAKKTNALIQMGGGIRREEDIRKLIDGGVARVVLGTKAIADLAFLQKMLKQFGEKIAVSLDCKNGLITKHGWVDTTNIQATDFVKQLESFGTKCIIYTDVARDGMLTGPNTKSLEELLSATSIPVIASGGVSTLADIKTLKKLENKGLLGAIVGKALYEKKFNLTEAIKLC